jgi:hypothetical protein
MTGDATFQDGQESPLNLGAMDAEDLAVVSMLMQDAVLPASEMSWNARQRTFALLVNRFRWEDLQAATRRGRAVERVQSVLVIDNVKSVSSQGIDPRDADAVLSLLAVDFEPGEECSGHVLLTFAGDGAIRLQVEALEARLKDVTRPYVDPARRAPDHPD